MNETDTSGLTSVGQSPQFLTQHALSKGLPSNTEELIGMGFVLSPNQLRSPPKTPADWLDAYGIDADTDLPESVMPLTWEVARNWINAAVWANFASGGDQNWGNLWMCGNAKLQKSWHDEYMAHVKPLLPLQQLDEQA